MRDQWALPVGPCKAGHVGEWVRYFARSGMQRIACLACKRLESRRRYVPRTKVSA